MNDPAAQAFAVAFSILCGLAAAAAYVALTGGGLEEFVIAAGLLFAIRLAFAFMEIMGEVLAWRTGGRGKAVAENLATLRTRRLPPKSHEHEDVAGYLARVEKSTAYSDAQRELARSLQHAGEWSARLGHLPAVRFHAAWQEALDLYSVEQPAMDAAPVAPAPALDRLSSPR